MSFGKTASQSVAVLFGFALTLVPPTEVAARSRGIQVDGCWNCHGTTDESALTITADRDPIMPGETVTFTATVSRPGVAVGGLFVFPPNLGELSTTSGQGLTLSGGSLTHSAPKAAVGESVTFEFLWTAPAEPGAVILGAYALAANGDRKNTGDAPGSGYVNFTFGCEPKSFYYDADADGHGTPDASVADVYISCADQPAPAGYAATADDCDDSRSNVHPSASERCNDEDDDCDGEVDENTSPETLWPDPDGDGFFGAGATATITGCLPLAGYAAEGGDCDPNDPARFPGAEEICNLLDDNCDGRIDEYVRPRCGEGRCGNEGPTCDPDDCVPAPAIAEICNQLDDDCDGEVDDEEPCSLDRVCLGHLCVAVEEDGAGGSKGDDSPGTPAGSGAGGPPKDPPGSGGTSGVGSQAATSGAPAGGEQNAPTPAAAGSEGQAHSPATVGSVRQTGCGFSPYPAPPAGRSSAFLLLLLLFGLGLRRRRERGT